MVEELQELVEENLDALLTCDGSGEFWPKAYVTLRIDLRLMDNEQREKVWQAKSLLREAGVSFDSGVGSGFMDWELDWSLGGAQIEVHALYCRWSECPNPDDKRGLKTAYWSLRRRLTDGYMSSLPYCSPECRERADGAQEAREIVLHDSAPAWRLEGTE